MIKRTCVFVALVYSVLSSPLPEDSLQPEIAINGGTNAPLGRFPFMAAVRTPRGQHLCASSIVNNRWVVTSARCIIFLPQNALQVVVGTVNWSSGGVVQNSQRLVPHPNFDLDTFRSNVGLIQTATVIGFNANVAAVALGSSAVGGGVNVIAVGWMFSRTNLLQHTQTTFTNADCRNRYASLNLSHLVLDQNICTNSPNGQG
jgi:hypothetical protein